MSKEEIRAKKKELRDSVNRWKVEHPKWEDSKFIEAVKPHVSKSTFDGVLYNLPFFCYFMDKTPDEIMNERLVQIRSDDQEERMHYENKFVEFRNFLQSHHYTGNSVKNRLGKIAGWFTNNGTKLMLPSNFWKRAKRASKKVEDFTEKIRLIDNSEIRLIIDIADNECALATLLGSQNGMLPDDITDLTWERIGLTPVSEKNFSYFLYNRKKTYEKHFVVINPDIKYFLKLVWLESGKPESGYILRGHQDSMHPGSLSHKFKEAARKALGKRGEDIKFKDLRDYYNSVLLRADLPDQYKKVLFGHKPSGEEGSYEYSKADLLLKYQENVFKLCSVNGFDQKVRTAQIEQLTKKIDALTNALTYVEKENSAYKIRVDNLQENYEKVSTNLERINNLLENLPEVLTSEDFKFKTKDWVRESKS